MAKFGEKINLFDSGISESENSLYISSSFFRNYEELREIPQLAITDNKVNYSDLEILKYRSKFEYNFLEKPYEEYIADNGIEELQLPNFYDFVHDKTLDTGRYNQIEGTSFFEDPEKIINTSGSEKTVYVSSSYKITDGGPSQYIPLDKYLRKYNPYKEQFPFYTEIKFNTHYKTKNNVSDTFFKRNLSVDFISYCINNLKSFTSTYNNNPYLFKYANINADFLDAMLMASNKDLSFIVDLNNRLNDKETGYTEIVGYRLQKFKGNPNTTSINAPLIQEWYFPNLEETTIEWIDSQIKYGQQYTYKFSFLVLTVAENRKTNNQELIVMVVEDENITPFYTNRLLDLPPIEPEIEFVPYIGIDNKIKLNMNTAIGKKRSRPIIISNKDNEQVLTLVEAQDSFDGLLTFQAEEPTQFFQIFRLDRYPKSYEDFIYGVRTDVNTDFASAASYHDKIEPNKKYYYIIRSIDYHKHFSNPTPIFEIESINDGGAVYLNINIVDLQNRANNVQPSKSFKRFLKLKPSLGHTLIDPKIDLASEQQILGVVDEKIWAKKFKIRLTSKSTGKKIDLNLSFNYTKEIK
jgi:hypothetical protein